jgi:TRAP-type uncharacterized transport system substrate-binding protein
LPARSQRSSDRGAARTPAGPFADVPSGAGPLARIRAGFAIISPRSLLAQSRTRLYIGTAGKEGVFYPLGTAMAAVSSKYVSEVDAIAQETNGTAENIKLLQQGNIELALAQPDLAWAASR